MLLGIVLAPAPTVSAAPKAKPRNWNLDLRQGEAHSTLQEDGQRYQTADERLLVAGMPSLAVLVGGDLAVASCRLTRRDFLLLGDRGWHVQVVMWQ